MASPIDLAIVFGYLILMLVIGFLVSRKEDLEGYFVNNRRTKTWMLVATTVATTIGGGAVIGIVSVSYQHGIGVGIVFFISVLLGWLLVAFLSNRIKAFGDKKMALTIGDFYAERYSKHARIAAASVLAMATFIWMAVQFVVMGNMFSILTGIDFRLALLVAAGVTIVYTSLGGIKSDFYTDAVQFWIMLLVFILLIPIGISHIGGINALSSLPASHFNLFTFGGPLFFFGGILLGIPYALVSMDVWQRVYAASDAKTAKKALTLTVIIQPFFYVASTVIGLIAAAALTGIKGDEAIFTLMGTVLPVGLLGIGMASLLAVVMSSLDSLIVTLSAIVTKDFYKSALKPEATSKQMLKLGRLVAFAAGIIALTLAYLLPDIIQLVIYGTTILLIFSPAMLGGFFWKRATAKAAVLSIAAGFTTTLALIPSLKEQAFVPATAISTIIFIAASYLTKHSATENIELMKAA
ncbi:sodium:solute symporter family protein [Candidatus Woesearchaeota archaeon]|nr:sodium:solute symporter family protein [Candidatus Woesearchaeota archaeon]